MKLLLIIARFFKKNIIRQVIYLILLIAIFGLFFFLKETQVLPQGAIFILPSIEQASFKEKVLIFAPHPDDETLAAGGYIEKAIKNQAEVYIVLITDGNRHRLREKRYQEFESATSMLGVHKDHLVFLNYPDGKLRYQDKNVLEQQFKGIIDSTQPNIVIYPIHEDHHLDHKTTGQILGIILNNYPNIKSYGYLIHHNYFPQPTGLHKDAYLMPPLSLLKFNQTWNSLKMDDTEENLKWEALKEYKTQFRNPYLKDTLPAFVRKNEIFVLGSK